MFVILQFLFGFSADRNFYSDEQSRSTVGMVYTTIILSYEKATYRPVDRKYCKWVVHFFKYSNVLYC